MGRYPVELAKRAKYKTPAMRVRDDCYGVVCEASKKVGHKSTGYVASAHLSKTNFRWLTFPRTVDKTSWKGKVGAKEKKPEGLHQFEQSTKQAGKKKLEQKRKNRKDCTNLNKSI